MQNLQLLTDTLVKVYKEGRKALGYNSFTGPLRTFTGHNRGAGDKGGR